MILVVATALGGAAWWGASWMLSRRGGPSIDPKQAKLRRIECVLESECKRGESCFWEADGKWRCRGNECFRDGDCSEGYVCREVINPMKAVKIQMCVLAGPQDQGEPCEEIPETREQACKADLVCYPYSCSRICLPGGPPCSPGFFCHLNGVPPACLPTCAESGCPQGESCVPLPGYEPASMCARIVGDPCTDRPCPPNHYCDYSISKLAVHQPLPMHCLPTCENKEPCPPGLECVVGQCMRIRKGPNP